MSQGTQFSDSLQDIIFRKDGVHLIKNHFLSSKEIEKQVSVIEWDKGYKFIKDICDPVIEKTKFPPIVELFYLYIVNTNKIPDPEDLFNAYIDKHAKIIQANPVQLIIDNKKYEYKGFKARFYRTYPSLVRDIHFYYLCSESNQFEDIRYSLKYDCSQGMDLYVQYQNIKCAINLFADTKRAKEYAAKKPARHDLKNIKSISVTMNMNKRKKWGDIFLYDKFHIEEIKKKIAELE